MVSAYHIASKVAPASTSEHTQGSAIHMNTTWTQPSITIVNGSGKDISINTMPRDGLNEKLAAGRAHV